MDSVDDFGRPGRGLASQSFQATSDSADCFEYQVGLACLVLVLVHEFCFASSSATYSRMAKGSSSSTNSILGQRY